MTPVTSTNDENVVLTYNPQTASGKPATIEGNLHGEILEGDGTVEEISGTQIRLKDATVFTKARVFGDADHDAGEVREIEDLVEWTVTDAEASTLGTVSFTTEARS